MKKRKRFLTRYECYLLRRTLKIMKLTTFILLITTMFVSASSYSQSTRLSLKFTEISYADMFKTIETQSEFRFAFSSSRLDPNQKVQINVKRKTLEEILDKTLPDGVAYEIFDRYVIIMNANDKKSANEMQQQQTISGTVTDEQGLSLPGVSIIIKGTTNGTTTNVDGTFVLSDVPEDATLVFTFIGMRTLEVPVSGQTTFNVTMNEVAINIEEVVAIGYGTKKRKDLTGSVGQVKSEDLTKTAVVGLDQAVKGKIAGVQVTTNSGEPGGDISMRIRGVGSINSSNEPLYIIDGVPYNSLNAINVNDIERIDVLKDAAAASIYGSRASNGVVLVTTKRGTKGLTISFDASVGVQSVANKLDLLNGQQFAKLANENLVSAGMDPNPSWSNPSTVQNSDWQSEIFRAAPVQSYYFNISSGGEKSSTMFSFSYHDQDGIIVGSSYKRYTLRLNSECELSEKIKVGIKLNGAFSEKQKSGTSVEAAISNQPTQPIYTSHEGLFNLNPDGSIDPSGDSFFGWNGYAFVSRFANVHFYQASQGNSVYRQYSDWSPHKSQQILSSGFIEYEAIKGLKIKSVMNLTFGHDLTERHSRGNPPEVSLIDLTDNFSQGWFQSTQWNWVNTISYNKTFDKHNISAVIGIDALESNSKFVDVKTYNVPSDQHSISASEIDTRVVTGYPSKYNLLSYFGRASYDYDGKYLISGTIRRDGSSNFAPSEQFGVFSSASVGWRISQENFMKDIEFIYDLKLRGSYGTVGNQNIPPFKYLSTYSTDGGKYQYTLGADQSAVGAIYQSNFGDPTIHWEKSTQTDIGLDLSVLSGKLLLTADYYIKSLDDLLGNFPVPIYTGVTGASLLRNGFSMENSGFELSVDFKEQIDEFKFSVGANFSTLNNKITQLTDNEKSYVSADIQAGFGAINDGGAETRTNVGGRIGTFYGYQTDGIIQTQEEADAYTLIGGLSPGDRKFKDTNGDGTINASDKVELGNGLPKYTFGLNLNAQYKAFDFSMFFNGQAGVQIANMLTFSLQNMRYYNSTGIINGSTALLDSWTPENKSNTMPRNTYTAPTSNRWMGEYYIEDGSFLRISNVQIGYTLNDNLLSKVGISKLRFYISGQNLYTFTKYSGYDPEIGSQDGNVLKTGVDSGRYPQARMINLGVNCTF